MVDLDETIQKIGEEMRTTLSATSRVPVAGGIAAHACSSDALTGANGCSCENLCKECSEDSATRTPEFGIAAMIDHTLLKPDATESQLSGLCEEAVRYGFASVCVNPTNAAYCAELLRGTNVKVCTVIGFPLGATTTIAKVIEARDAVANGVQEVDMVMNIGAMKSGNHDLVMRDIRSVVDAVAGKCITKVIIETALLSDEDKIRSCLIAKWAGADFVKTSTGFGPGGATVEDVELMRKTVGESMGVKASGGIRNAETAQKMIAAGASRIGASASVSIAKDAHK